jgi:lipopolysaccharide transport system permease protein
MKARYAQTVLGVAWAIIQPLAALVIFTIVFSLWAKLPSDGLPYPLFAYAALLPWTLLARSLERSGQSVVAESNLVKKVYFPRVILPIASTLAGVIDFVIAFALFLLLMAWYGIAPTWKVIAIPMLVLFTLGTSLAVSLWLSALNVHYRDVAGAIPLLTQLWMYASPVVYPLALVPEQWRTVYSLNPMAGIIEGFRWALLGGAAPDTRTAMLSASATGILLIFGLIFFNRMSRTFSDVV